MLKFVPQANLTSLDPIWTTASVTENHAYAVYDTLSAVDSKIEPQPQMAEGYTVSDDGRLYLIKLRDGLKFHNGEPVRAQDCAPSLQRWAARDTFGQTLAKFIDTWGAKNDKTVKIALKAPFPLLTDALAKPAADDPFVMPEPIANTDPMQQIKETIGSGPFRFVAEDWVPDSSAAYEKFDDYVPCQGPPDWASGAKVVHFKRVEWKIIPDAAIAAAALQAGEVDWWEQVEADLVPLLKRNQALKVGLANPTGYMGVMRFNELSPPFNEARIRRAVLVSANQDDYMRAVSGNDPSAYKICKALFSCGTPFGTPVGASEMQGDVTLGRKLLQEAGYAGQKVAIINPTDIPSIGPFGEVSYDLLNNKLGMNAELQETDCGTVVQHRASKNPVDQGGWSVFHTCWPSDSILNPVLSAIVRGQGASGWFGWFSNAKIEQLTGDFLSAKDQATRMKLTDAVQKGAFRQAPTVPLGLFYIRNGYQANLSHMLESQRPFFWSVRRA